MSMTYDGTNGITFPDSSQQKTAAKVGMVNRIINGDMRIDQRNAGAATANTINNYTLDRWYVAQSTTGKIIVQQNAGGVTPPAGFTNYLGVTSQSSYSVGSGDYYGISQRIEGFNVADLGFGSANASTVTLSFYVYSSLTGTFGGALLNGSYNRAYPFSYSVPTQNTWTKITVTIPGDTAGTWAKDNSSGMIANFALGYGSTYGGGTAGSWVGSNIQSVTGAVSIVGTSGATFYITGVQLEKGSTATSFDYRFYGHELDLCQRYYEYGGVSTRHYIYASGTGRYAGIRVDFKQEKRVAPSISLANGYTTDGWGSYGVESHNNPTGATNTLKSFTVNCTSTQTDNSLAIIACTWTASAEL